MKKLADFHAHLFDLLSHYIEVKRPISRHPSLTKPCLEALEERYAPAGFSFEWSPLNGSTRASDGNNWLNLAMGGVRGKGPMDAPGAAVELNGAVSNSPIEWNYDPAYAGHYDYEIGNFVLNAYTAQQTIDGKMTVNTASTTVPDNSTLNIYFVGPSEDSINGSWFVLGQGNNSISNLYLQGAAANPCSGDFVIQSGGGLIMGQLANQTDVMIRTTMDVAGAYTLEPSSTGSFSSLVMDQGSVVAVTSTGHLLFDDLGLTSGFVGSDGSAGEMIWVQSQGHFQVNSTTSDTIGVPLLNDGLASFYGNSTTNAKVIFQGTVPAEYGPECSVDNIANAANNSGYLYLWKGVNLLANNGYFQSSNSPAYSAILQADTSNVSITVNSGFNINIGQYSSVIYATTPNVYGTLYFNGNCLFNGKIQPEVCGSSSSLFDSIQVNGNIEFGTTAYVTPIMNGSYLLGTPIIFWRIFSWTGSDSGWSNVLFASGFKADGDGCVTHS